MLTNEQCTRVAIELWGLYLDGDGRYCEEWAMLPESSSYIFDARGGPEFLTPENLSDEVNSWEGFGRTVEAMAERGYELKCTYRNSIPAYESALAFVNKYDQRYFIDPENLVESGHLAALEALK